MASDAAQATTQAAGAFAQMQRPPGVSDRIGPCLASLAALGSQAPASAPAQTPARKGVRANGWLLRHPILGDALRAELPTGRPPAAASPGDLVDGASGEPAQPE